MQTVKIGVIGAGENTRKKHLPGFQAIEGVELVCVANRSRESGEKVAREFKIPKVAKNWQEVVEDAEVDAVCIGTWPNLHAPITCAALAAGKHVLCEARMAMNAAEAQRMLAAAQATDRVAMLVPSPFGLKGDAKMRELLGQDYVGEVREVYVRGLTAALADERAPLHWRQRGELSGVNVLILGILNETVSRWVGRTESVMAETSHFIPRRLDTTTGWLTDADVPDCVSVIARLGSGSHCVYMVSGVAYHAGNLRVEIYGSRGTLHYDLTRDEIWGAQAGEKVLERLEIPLEMAGGWRVEAEFIEAIREGTPVRFTNFVDGVRYMKFTEAVRRSANQGRRVPLAEV